jgi:pimeloyl-ACP methyl ester carboxylesterase
MARVRRPACATKVGAGDRLVQEQSRLDLPWDAQRAIVSGDDRKVPLADFVAALTEELEEARRRRAERGLGQGTLRRPAWTLVVSLALVLCACGGGGHRTTDRQLATNPTGHPTTTLAPVRHRATQERASGPPFRVGSITLDLEEPSDPSISDARTSSDFIRRLPTVVRYPAAGPPNGQDNPGAPPASNERTFPLLIFSQGYDMPPQAYSWLLRRWASAGFVVAAPAYPFTNPTTPGGPNEADIVNHPADLRFVIGTLRKKELLAGEPLSQEINPNEVAVIGHSDGGDVSLAVAAASCCRDRTVKAAVILSGSENRGFDDAYYTTGSVPLLVVQGSADTISPAGCSIDLYDQAPRPKYYVELIGAQHLQPYVDPGPDRSLVARAVLDFLARYLEGRSSGLAALARDGNAPPVARLIIGGTGPGPESYCPAAPAP